MAQFPGKSDPKAPAPTGNQPKPVSQNTLLKRAQLHRQEHQRTLSNAGKVNLKKPDKPVKSEAPTKPKKSIVPAKPAELPPMAPKPSMVMSAPPMVQGSKTHITIPPNPLFGNALRDWETRGMLAMSAFLDTLEGQDQKAMTDAFYGTSPGTGLRETIREVTDKTNQSDLAELDSWIDDTLAGRSRQSVAAILESITEDFGGTGRLFQAVSDRLIRRARALLKNEAHWQGRFDERGLAQTLDVVAALQEGSTSKLKCAFFDPGFQTPQQGKNPRLYETIKERIGDNDPAQERASFDRWAGEALKGCEHEDLHRIYETLLVNQRDKVCTGGVFAEVDAALRRNINERISSDQFVQTVLKNGDVGEAADEFSAAVGKSTLGDIAAMHGRMSALIAADLAKLPTIVIAQLKERCADLPAYRGVTALRFCLGMADHKAVDSLFLELSKGDRSEAGMTRLRAVYRLAEDQLATETGKETETRIRAALKDLIVQKTILIAARHQELPFGGNLHELLVTHLCSAVSAAAPRHFVNEYLNHGRTPFDVLALLEKVVFSFVGLNSNSIGQVNAALVHAIRAALGDLTEQELGELARLDFSPAGKEVAVAFDNQIQARIGALKDELANKYLLPQPVNLKLPKN